MGKLAGVPSDEHEADSAPAASHARGGSNDGLWLLRYVAVRITLEVGSFEVGFDDYTITLPLWASQVIVCRKHLKERAISLGLAYR